MKYPETMRETYDAMTSLAALTLAIMPLAEIMKRGLDIVLLAVAATTLLAELIACWLIYTELRKILTCKRLPMALIWAIRLITLFIMVAAAILIYVIPVFPIWIKCLVPSLLLGLWLRSQLWYYAPYWSK